MCVRWVIHCSINFIFKGYFSVVFGGIAVDVLLADLTYGFDNSWFCDGIRVESHMNDLGISWRVFCTRAGRWEKDIKIVKIYFTLLPSQKKIVARSCSWVWWHHVKVENKMPKSFSKIMGFQFFKNADEVDQKSKFKKFSYTTLQTILQEFLYMRYLHTVYVKTLNSMFISNCFQK